MVVLDTDFLIDVMRSEPAAVEALRELVDGFEPVAISAVTVMQLHHGVARSDRPDTERRRIARALAAATTYAFDHDVAARAGELDGHLAKRGERIGAADTMIAATALEHTEPVLSRNVKHFERVDGLGVRTY